MKTTEQIFNSLPEHIRLKLTLAWIAGGITAVADYFSAEHLNIFDMSMEDLNATYKSLDAKFPEIIGFLKSAPKDCWVQILEMKTSLPAKELLIVNEALGSLEPLLTPLKIDIIQLELNLNFHDLFVNHEYKDLLAVLPKSVELLDFKFKMNSEIMKHLDFSVDTSFFKQGFPSFPSKATPFKARPKKTYNSGDVLQNTLVIMTEVVYNTLGDFYAAHRLITAIKHMSPTLHVIWLIMEKEKNIPGEVLASDETYIFSNWTEMTNSEQFKYAAQAAVAVTFPTFHFLSNEQLDLINRSRTQCGLKQIVSVLEYDYDLPSQCSDLTLETGFGKNALGVFLQKPLTETDQQLATMLAAHPGLEGLYSGKSLEEYRASNICFFGYRNKQVGQVVNCVNTSNFVQLVVATCKKRNNQRHIDILAPISSEEVTNLKAISHYFSVNGITRIQIIDTNEPLDIQIVKNATTERHLRIFSCFPLPNKLFRAAMQIADGPLIMCTGDQSFSDVLGIPGAIPFYQIMRWKQALYERFITLAQQVLGDCVLTKYLMMAENKIPGAILPEFTGEHLDRMQQQMRVLQDYLIKHCNLFDNLPQRLIEMVRLEKEALRRSDEAPAADSTKENDPTEPGYKGLSFFPVKKSITKPVQQPTSIGFCH